MQPGVCRSASPRRAGWLRGAIRGFHADASKLLAAREAAEAQRKSSALLADARPQPKKLCLVTKPVRSTSPLSSIPLDLSFFQFQNASDSVSPRKRESSLQEPRGRRPMPYPSPRVRAAARRRDSEARRALNENQKNSVARKRRRDASRGDGSTSFRSRTSFFQKRVRGPGTQLVVSAALSRRRGPFRAARACKERRRMEATLGQQEPLEQPLGPRALVARRASTCRGQDVVV